MDKKLHPKKDNSVGIGVIGVDWSGTISDDRRLIYELNMRLLERRGMPRFSFEKWIFGLTPLSASTVTFLAEHGFEEDPKAVREEFKAIYSNILAEGKHPVAYPDTKDVLSFLSNKVPVVVISSHPEEFLVKEASTYGVKGYISAFEGGVDNKTERILKICSQSGEDPCNVMYLGDMVADIQAAKGAGVRSAAVSTGYHGRDWLARENPDLVVDSLTEFQHAVAEMLRGSSD
jgi:phosphoglycolate phosphatase-like HAD superfamily hydrolase